MIISYHPAIFQPLKRLTQSEWKQRSIVKCIEKKIAVYSPHTAWDTIDGGINDWILQAFGKKTLKSILRNSFLKVDFDKRFLNLFKTVMKIIFFEPHPKITQMVLSFFFNKVKVF